MRPVDWLDRRVLVCVGTGGVGKTTVSAAIGLEAARRGKRVLVLTIDPARRLADALGAGPLDHRERELPRAVLEEAGVAGDGRVFAMMLDTKRTFDEIVTRYAPDRETLERIFANPIYQNLTDALAGSREYSAIEQLHQLHARDEYDLIVLDTPPARHALEFLDAPRRLTGMFDTQLLKLMFRPAAAMGRTGFRLFRLGSSTVLRTIERISGFEFLRAVSEFLLVFENMLDGFSSRALETEALLRGPSCAFVLVSGPDREQGRRAQLFWDRLATERVRVEGLVINRVRSWPGTGPAPELAPPERREAEEWLTRAFEAQRPGWDPRAAARGVVEAAVRQASLARRDADNIAALRAVLPLESTAVRVVPLFSEDVHSVGGLAQLSARLFGEVGDG